MLVYRQGFITVQYMIKTTFQRFTTCHLPEQLLIQDSAGAVHLTFTYSQTNISPSSAHNVMNYTSSVKNADGKVPL